MAFGPPALISALAVLDRSGSGWVDLPPQQLQVVCGHLRFGETLFFFQEGPVRLSQTWVQRGRPLQ